MKKAGMIVIGVFVLSVLAFCFFFVPNPFKVTDPSNPGFKVENFQFKDYGSLCSLEDALAKIFPVGTNKAYVDRVLLRISGVSESSSHEKLGDLIVTYNYVPLLPTRVLIYPNGLTINIVYDSSGGLNDMLTPYGVFPGRSVFNSERTCN